MIKLTRGSYYAPRKKRPQEYESHLILALGSARSTPITQLCIIDPKYDIGITLLYN